MPNPNRRLIFACLAAAMFPGAPAWAQPAGPPPLRLDGIKPAGLRMSATERWGAYEIDLSNLTDVDRLARVVMFFEGRSEVQYARDTWVPARSTCSSRMLVGPAVSQEHANRSDIQVLLYDLTGGDERLVLPPGEERVRSRPVFFQKHEPYTVVLADDPPESPAFGQLPVPESPSDEAVHLARVLRQASSFSEFVHIVNSDSLPPTAEAFDGVDHLVVASDRIGRDPAGIRALRQWLGQGGRALVLLDRVRPETLAALLGNASDFQVVDRVALTDFRFDSVATGGWAPPPAAQRLDQPVEFVRVLLPADERTTKTVNGWPAWFVRRVGRGKVVFLALGARAWFRPRTRRDPVSPYTAYPGLPVAAEPLSAVATELCVPDDDLFRGASLRPLLTEEIGYAVVGRGTVALVFGAALLAATAVGFALRRLRRRELLGWLGPAAALAAAAVLAALGESSRRAAPPTVAVAQIIDAVPSADESPVRGQIAIYQPDSGPLELGSTQGVLLKPDMTGVEDQSRRFRMTDLDAWRWDNLSLAAGVHFASFHGTTPTGGPITAVAHFGPQGVEGRLQAGLFRGLSDPVLAARDGRNLSVRLDADGGFRAGGPDVLPAGEFLAGAVLSDRQQRRRNVYREFLERPIAPFSERRNTLLMWADPVEMTPLSTGRRVGSALLVVPLEFERSRPGARVVVPGPFIPYRQVLDAGLARPTLEATHSADMNLRFQLPAAALPLHVERARLSARINAPSRRVTVSVQSDGGPVELFHADSPLDPIHVDVADPRLLQLDGGGGMHVNLSLSDPTRKPEEDGDWQGDEKWAIEFLEVEITGTTTRGE
jgi:hypothetical protein